MTNELTLRTHTLTRQGLTSRDPFGKGINATLKAIEQLSYIQIDTLAVVERAHHHSLWNRVSDYKPEYPNTLVQQGKIFEYWFHAAAYLPMRDYRFSLPRMNAIKRGESKYYRNVDKKLEQYVFDKILRDGPARARDFKSISDKSGTWWNWKPSKHALEKLFMQGDLMISGRAGMEKIYDVRERVLPSHVVSREPNIEEQAEHLIDLALTAHAFTSLKQIVHLRAGKQLRNAVECQLKERSAAGQLEEILVDGMQTQYATKGLLDSKPATRSEKIRILSPFDNAIIHRDRVDTLFKFNYRLECYVPAHKRQYGYFCLPLLYKDKLIGQIDCKAHRAQATLEVIHAHLDQKTVNVNQLGKALEDFASFNGCETVTYGQSIPNKFVRAINKANT